MQTVVGDIPKGLIELGNKTIIDHLMERLSELEIEVSLITNQKFFAQYETWRETSNWDCKILNDGTENAEQRLGAVGDLQFAINQLALDEDVLLVGSDNLLGFSLTGLRESFEQDPVTHICTWKNGNMSDQTRRGVVKVGPGSKVVSFTEKPEKPDSPFAAAPLYVLPAATLRYVSDYLERGGNPDSPGYLFQHLVQKVPIKAWEIPGKLLDVGNPESYLQAQAFVERY